MATLNEARAAKERAKEVLADLGEIRGIGIARTADGFGVKVNLAHEIEQYLPEDLDGVPLVVEIVGEIRPLDMTSQVSPRGNASEGGNNEQRDATLALDIARPNASENASGLNDEDA